MSSKGFLYCSSRGLLPDADGTISINDRTRSAARASHDINQHWRCTRGLNAVITYIGLVFEFNGQSSSEAMVKQKYAKSNGAAEELVARSAWIAGRSKHTHRKDWHQLAKASTQRLAQMSVWVSRRMENSAEFNRGHGPNKSASAETTTSQVREDANASQQRLIGSNSKGLTTNNETNEVNRLQRARGIEPAAPRTKMSPVKADIFSQRLIRRSARDIGDAASQKGKCRGIRKPKTSRYIKSAPQTTSK
ncbi:hypothetical protein B0H17DRAFT_1153501 [Mycena rosella]|uniref:Uncharacterized protein n=1 Tax=Mycena rosella TaxID=1033263 RepID=A0AAD7FC39_MYCRO|nr:hypothetical protein B0H17DRAFT_1153501 [Mycena rosella]